MREPSQSMAPSQEGHWQSKDFQIRWHGTLSASGWVIVCTLSQHATNCQYTLDRRTLSQQFELGDAEQQVWGTLALCNVLNEVDCLALEMDLHCEPMLEEVQRLCTWRVCDPCSSVLPTQGQQTLGKWGEIKASWTIAGADQACSICARCHCTSNTEALAVSNCVWAIANVAREVLPKSYCF